MSGTARSAARPQIVRPLEGFRRSIQVVFPDSLDSYFLSDESPLAAQEWASQKLIIEQIHHSRGARRSRLYALQFALASTITLQVRSQRCFHCVLTCSNSNPVLLLSQKESFEALVTASSTRFFSVRLACLKSIVRFAVGGTCETLVQTPASLGRYLSSKSWDQPGTVNERPGNTKILVSSLARFGRQMPLCERLVSADRSMSFGASVGVERRRNVFGDWSSRMRMTAGGRPSLEEIEAPFS